MSRLAYITPDKAPEGFECRELFVPIGQTWQAIIAGAISELTNPDRFECIGGLSAEQTAAIFEQTWFAWNSEELDGCPMFAGMIVAAARSVTPGGWLLCDGAAYNTADYQSLYDAIGTTFGVGGAGTFKVPDMRGRGPIGVGSGAGLTPRSLADSGGEETHALTVAELAAHKHVANFEQDPSNPKRGTGTAIYNYWPSWVPADPGTTLETEATGEDTAHENMQPFLALNFYIYAGQ